MNISNWLSHIPVIGRHFGAPTPASPPPPKIPREELQRTGPRQDPTLRFRGFDDLPPISGKHKLGLGPTFQVDNPAAKPPLGPGLTAMSFNTLLGGQRREAFMGYLRDLDAQGRMPDVVALQEANQEIAVLLAKEFGYHLAYYGREADESGRLVGGKAILSRHPIHEATHFTYGTTEADRQAAIRRKGKVGELAFDRGALRVSLQVEGRRVDVFDVHHTLGDPTMNGKQLKQLVGLVKQSREGGREAVVLGDFNANMNVKREGSWLDAHRGDYDPTDTAEEFQARYGSLIGSLTDGGLGNIGSADVRAAFRALEELAPDVWDHAEQASVRQPDGQLVSPAEARELLNSGRVERGTAEWQRLQNIADAATLSPESGEATGKRFDGAFASSGFRAVRAEIDRTSAASDHQPILLQLELKARLHQ